MKKTICLILAVFMGISSVAFAEEIDYDSLNFDELTSIINGAEDALQRNFTVSYSLNSKLMRLTSDLVGSRLTDGEMDWTNADWVYERAWDEISVDVVATITRNGISTSCDVNAMFIEDEDAYLPVLLIVDDVTLLDARGDESYMETYDSDSNGEDEPEEQPTVEFVDDL
ncbi:MAG: acid shock protein, partial [Clostridia bacterium]|nr:acid shock protein [Clostridia bacterium]